MLLRLPPELLSHVAHFIGTFWSTDKAALRALSLTCRAVAPFARAKILRRISVTSGARVDLVVSIFPMMVVRIPQSQQIAKLQHWTNIQRRIVRDLRVAHLSPTSGKTNKTVSHDVLADVLALLPSLEFLEADHFLGVRVSDRLATALSHLDLLRTVIISSGSTNAPASGIFAFISSLSPRASFDLIRINVPGQPKSSKRAQPKLAINSPRIFCIPQELFESVTSVTKPGSLSREAMWAGFAACCGTSLAYLDMSISWLHEDLLRSVAPTIRALCIRPGLTIGRANINERLLRSDISLPRLECLQLPLATARRIANLRSIPMFSTIRALVIPRSSHAPDLSSAHLDVVWESILIAKFEVVGIAAYASGPISRAPVQAQMFPWRGVASLRGVGTEVVDCEDSAYPDLLALVERRVCVSIKGLWRYQW